MRLAVSLLLAMCLFLRGALAGATSPEKTDEATVSKTATVKELFSSVRRSRVAKAAVYLSPYLLMSIPLMLGVHNAAHAYSMHTATDVGGFGISQELWQGDHGFSAALQQHAAFWSDSAALTAGVAVAGIGAGIQRSVVGWESQYEGQTLFRALPS